MLSSSTVPEQHAQEGSMDTTTAARPSTLARIHSQRCAGRSQQERQGSRQKSGRTPGAWRPVEAGWTRRAQADRTRRAGRALSIEYFYLLFKGTGHESCRRNCQSIENFQLTDPPFVISAHLTALHFGVSHEYHFLPLFLFKDNPFVFLSFPFQNNV